MANLPDGETAVFEDEGDLNTNPKIGAMRMRCGFQAHVVTPDNNVKRHRAGSLHGRTGKLLVSFLTRNPPGCPPVPHVDDIRRRLGRYRRIDVICDNAPFHRCAKVRKYLARWGHRIVIHFLPKYAPQTNPMERLWWHLHEEITRNHRCKTIDEMIELTIQWLGYQSHFAVETSIYPQVIAA